MKAVRKNWGLLVVTVATQEAEAIRRAKICWRGKNSKRYENYVCQRYDEKAINLGACHTYHNSQLRYGGDFSDQQS